MNTGTEAAREELGASFNDLFSYNQSETARWKRWLEANPAALDVNVGGAHAQTVRNLVAHIFHAELFLSGSLLNEEYSRAGGSEAATLDEIFALHTKASERVLQFMQSMTTDELKRTQEFRFKPGFVVSKRKLLTQFFLHGVHHWAQIALLVRQAGFPSDGPHDFILSSVVE